MILDDIVAKKKVYLEKAKDKTPFSSVAERAEKTVLDTLDFSDALKNPEKISIIAEVKCASPSKGLIRLNFDHMEIAREYLKSDVQAMSVLTETDFFRGSPEFLSDIRGEADIPLLRKDFIIDEYQIYEARALGASAILLIAAILGDKELSRFKELAHSLSMQCLCEAHDSEELKRAAALGFGVVGINNRDLKTFNEDITTTERLMKYAPSGAVIVSESSIKNSEDLKYLRRIGVDAVLIGETFMRSDDISAAVRKMRGEM